MDTRILISSNPDNLRAALSTVTCTATVEAEYGDEVVEGTEVTLAHHGPRAGRPCPCIGENLCLNVQAIGVSHFDLDTLGGVMRVLGTKPLDSDFWRAAAVVDTQGAHKVHRADVYQDTLDKVHAFWAWSEANRLFPPRDGSAEDVTEFFAGAAVVLNAIIEETDPQHEQLLESGRSWAAAKAKLEADSFVVVKGGVVLRMADTFTNHLYEHGGQPALAVVALNTKSDSVTVSLADPIEGVDCCKLMQRLFGPLAGGHAGIAGTPRNETFMLHDAERVMEALILEIAAATTEVAVCS